MSEFEEKIDNLSEEPKPPLARRAWQLDRGMIELEQLDQAVLGKSCTGPSDFLRNVAPRTMCNYGGCDCDACCTKSAIASKETELLRGGQGLAKNVEATIIGRQAEREYNETASKRAISQPLRLAG